jgi:hypothetical protein
MGSALPRPPASSQMLLGTDVALITPSSSGDEGQRPNAPRRNSRKYSVERVDGMNVILPGVPRALMTPTGHSRGATIDLHGLGPVVLRGRSERERRFPAPRHRRRRADRGDEVLSKWRAIHGRGNSSIYHLESIMIGHQIRDLFLIISHKLLSTLLFIGQLSQHPRAHIVC